MEILARESTYFLELSSESRITKVFEPKEKLFDDVTMRADESSPSSAFLSQPMQIDVHPMVNEVNIESIRGAGNNIDLTIDCSAQNAGEASSGRLSEGDNS